MNQKAPTIYRILILILPSIRKFMRFPVLKRLYSWLCDLWAKCPGTVETQVHGTTMTLNGGNPYPLLVSALPWFNAPLIELSHHLSMTLGRRIHFVDVGSSIGDTVALLKERCPESIEHFVCVEGDPEFYSLLAHNMSQFADVTTINVMLARRSMEIGGLEKHHKGTASATGANKVSAVRLDSLANPHLKQVDLLKIDVDGFDGEVLSGATDLLQRNQPPAVIFEWHPVLCKKTGNDPMTAFDTLAECGYNRFAWFDNLGGFNHFSGHVERQVLSDQAEYLIAVNHRRDAHFDVIALHQSSQVSIIKIASLEYAEKWGNR